MNDEIEALAAEIADAEGLDFERARDAAAIDLADLGQYAEAWNAERRSAWYALREWARAWDRMALTARIWQLLNKREELS